MELPTPSDALSSDECPRCVPDGPLCAKCKRSILPQLKQPSWRWLIGVQHYFEKKPKLSKAGQKIYDRKAEKETRRRLKEATQTDGLTPDFCKGGCGEPVAGSRSMCGPCRETLHLGKHAA